MVGANIQAIAEGKPLPYGFDYFETANQKVVEPEYTEGFEFAKNGGKLKANPYWGGSSQWWAWNNGYKAAKEIQAREQRTQARGGVRTPPSRLAMTSRRF